MSLARVYSRACVGIDAPQVTIEVHLANGLPAFNLVGLAEAAVKESRDRVRSALLNSGFEFPAKRITVNLAPADLPKGGGRFDLAIAIGIIAANGLLDETDLEQFEFIGELALDGTIRGVSAALPFNFACQHAKRIAVIPKHNAPEAGLIQNSQIWSADTLHQVFMQLAGQLKVEEMAQAEQPQSASFDFDIADIRGQQRAKRALLIAAAGRHNMLLVGPPGTGKTMLAKRLLTLLPQMTEQQALETARIHSVLGKPLDTQNWRQRQFRSPHHTSSAVALVGGGSHPKPGEISLAHNGVLFLDELPEFERRVLDVLREPLESAYINISRAAQQVTFPADFQLIAAMNPCPTGDIHDGRSTPDIILRYLNRISGPFLDRIDLQVDVPRLATKHLFEASPTPQQDSQSMRQTVERAIELQFARVGKYNSQLSAKELNQYCTLDSDLQAQFEQAADNLNLSLHTCHRLLKVARTIADLQQQPQIEKNHLFEALSYRALDDIIRQFS